MSIKPDMWRTREALSLGVVARRIGITGRNPNRTLQRYETGESPAPVAVIDAYRDLSGGEVTAEDWLDVRRAWLNAHSPALRTPRGAGER
jgi:predicted transcriptional regulator